MDIENLREFSTEIKESNAKAFDIGDLIQITEKFDGANASACWDDETESMIAFSRKQELSYNKTLSGFWEYINNLSDLTVDVFKSNPNWVVFGEWSVKNKIVYDDNKKKHWYVYDIYDTEKQKWIEQFLVKSFCEVAKLEYIHELYNGGFISWEHCRSFMNSPAYGSRQEGIVVKNQTKLNSTENRFPFYLKIVNSDFAESMKSPKIIDLEKEESMSAAMKITESIVTKNRVEKMIYKLRDEGILPEKINPTDMKLVAINLPKRVYDDCIKEENELVKLAGEYFSRHCNSLTMKFAKEIILQ